MTAQIVTSIFCPPVTFLQCRARWYWTALSVAIYIATVAAIASGDHARFFLYHGANVVGALGALREASQGGKTD